MPSGALAGLCPACLLAQGFPTDAGGSEKPGRFVAPPLEWIAALFPRLEVVAMAGTDGMGAVYKARQPALDRWVALKVRAPEPRQTSPFGTRQPASVVGRIENAPAAVVRAVVPRRIVPGPLTTARLAQAPRVLRKSGVRLDA